MKITHKEINFEDARGTITDIFVKDPQDHGTIIMSKKGAVRGNHYHKTTKQSDFILSGKLISLSILWILVYLLEQQASILQKNK